MTQVTNVSRGEFRIQDRDEILSAKDLEGCMGLALIQENGPGGEPKRGLAHLGCGGLKRDLDSDFERASELMEEFLSEFSPREPLIAIASYIPFRYIADGYYVNPMYNYMAGFLSAKGIKINHTDGKRQVGQRNISFKTIVLKPSEVDTLHYSGTDTLLNPRSYPLLLRCSSGNWMQSFTTN